MRKKPPETDAAVIQKIIDYCNKINMLIQRFGPNYETFIADIAFQMSCGMCVIQIGELTTRLTDNFKNLHSEIAWNEIKALRNIHAHDYDNVDFEITWEILTEDIPALKKSLLKILEVM